MVCSAISSAKTLLLASLALSLALPGQTPASRDLANASLEDLMNMQVTSVSKKEQKLSKVGAAVFVITQEDIHRSGATNIPDVLRMVPGVEVAQIDSSTWAVSIRGFNARYSNKVLVLIDGRTVYTPNFSGVYWDQQSVPLEDIERIEVIRGPGGTVWGANAMNGVINITTRSAKATRGGLMRAGAGSSQTATGLVQYGGAIGQNGVYRAFGQYFDIRPSALQDGSGAVDGWHMSHGGFRSDWDLSPRDTMTVQGDLYQNGEGQTATVVYSNQLRQGTISDQVAVGGGNILGRWNRTLANGSELSLQTYYDRYNRLDLGMRDVLNTADLDFHHRVRVGARQDVVWGLSYRVADNAITPGFGKTFVPARRTDHLSSAFVQDEIRLTNSLWLTLGSKLEHNAYTGFEYEPSAQLVWSVSGRQTIWLAASRAIRQPSRTDTGLRVDTATFSAQNGLLAVVEVTGNPASKAEELRDYEAGYRVQVNKRLSIDLAAFWSQYRHLQSVEPGDLFITVIPAPPHLVSPRIFDNKARAQTRGAEVFATWSVTNRWKISPGYSTIRMAVSLDPSSMDTTTEAIAGDSARHRVQLRSLMNLSHSVDLDSSLYFASPQPNGEVDGYTRLDTRLGWRLGESLEFSAAGQNLLTPRRAEFEDAFEVHHTLVKRSVFGKITWRF